MFNNSARDSAALDRWLTGESAYRGVPVVAYCAFGHSWRTRRIYDMGTSDIVDPDCPECGAPAKDDPEPWEEEA